MDLRELPARNFDRHPWEVARADFFLAVLREPPLPPSACALDVGAGDGYLARRLLGELPGLAGVTCFDPAYGPEWLEPSSRPAGLDFTRTWPTGPFDLVLLLDVLEHADDDRGLLAEAVARVAPGGLVLLSAPAHPVLFSHHDILLGHKRRYARATLDNLAHAAGLDPVAGGQLFASLLIPRSLAKVGEALRGPAAGGESHAPASGHVETSLGTWHHGSMVTQAVKKLLALDAGAGRLAARAGLPWPGLSVWLLARRP